MRPNLTKLLALAVAAALAVPAGAAVAKPGKHSKKSNAHSLKAKAKAKSKAKSKAQAKSQAGKAKGKAKPKNGVFKGVVVSVDAAAGSVVVKVSKANRWGRSFVGDDVSFAVGEKTKVIVADTNADSKRDLGDVKAEDRVLVQARLPRVVSDATQPFAARKVIDQTSPKKAEEESETVEQPVVAA